MPVLRIALPRNRLLRWGAPALLLLGIAYFFTTHVLPRWFPLAYASAWGALGAPDPRNLPESLRDLPVVLSDSGNPKGPVAILISGNAGWWGIDDQLAEHLAQGGVTSIGLNSLGWFIQARTPEETAGIIKRMADAFDQKRPLLLVGYSFGADIAATVYARLPTDLRSRIRLVSLLGLSRRADYAIGFWKISDHSQATVAAVAGIDGPHVQCFRGVDEGARSACNLLDPAKVEIITVPGGHHFNGDYAGLAHRILDGLDAAPKRG